MKEVEEVQMRSELWWDVLSHVDAVPHINIFQVVTAGIICGQGRGVDHVAVG